MLFESITLYNFRQFYNKQTINFVRPDGPRNITLIHGENGAGKTALLNAFNWCFYNYSNLESGHKLLNERKELELEVGETEEVRVTIRFKNNNRKYSITRLQVCERVSNSAYRVVEESCHIEYIDETGKTVTSDNMKIIEQIMPETMSSYFFFDGEKIDNLSKVKSAEDIQKAVKSIMGLEVMERASFHLDKAKKVFRNEFQKHGSDETQALVEDLKNVEGEIEDKQKGIEEYKSSQVFIKKEINAIDQKLKELEGAKELQERREKLQAERSQLNDEIDNVNKQIIKMCSEKGSLAFGEVAIKRTIDILEATRKKGEIPSGIKEQFVEDLLERKICICGQPLEPGTIHYEEVAKWKRKATSEELESSYIKICADVRVLEQKRNQLFIDLKRLTREKENLRKGLSYVEEEIDKIGDKLGKETEEIGELENKRKSLSLEQVEIHQKVGVLIDKIKHLELKRQEVELKIKKSEVENEKSKVAKKRMDACESSIELISEILKLQAQYVREELQNKITKVFEAFLRKGYIVELDEEYSIKIYKPFGNSKKLVDMSTGERQVTSLAFIGALVDTARKQEERSSRNELFKGGIIPIIMDSPFGSLDDDHQARIAQGIPTLAHQIVVLVSSSQWRGIKNKMHQFVGKEYELIYFDPKKHSKLDHEYTEIQEVTNYAKTN
ncbi:AAA family ATPase [Priestia megaterium]